MAAYLTKDEAARIVQLNPKTIERLVKRGELPGSKLAGRLRIHPDDLEQWIAASAVTPSVHDI